MDNYFVSSCKRVKGLDLQAVWAKEKRRFTTRNLPMAVRSLCGKPDGQVKKRRRMSIYFSAKKSQDFARIYVVSSPVP